MFYFRLLLSLFLLSASLSAQGIQFEHGAWAEALAKAKAENKIVFLDAFATWCGPCKMLTNQTFPDSSVGAYFNAHFVNVKMDMEKGEGVELARKYGVEVYPTLLFFQPDGVVAHRAAGFYPVAQFLELGKTATDPTRNLYALETRYRSGDRDRVFLRQLIEARAAAYDPRAAALANEYLDQETDLNTPENKQIILRFASDPTSKAFKYLVQNRKAFEPQVTEGEVSQFVDQVFQNYLQNNPTLQPDQLQRIFATCYPEQGEQAASLYRLTYFQQRSDFAKYATSAVDHFKRFPSENADELNEAAFLFSESATNKTLLEPALAWAEKAATLQETTYNRLTQAKILVKLGRKKEAVKAAQRSVELAKAAGVDDAQGQLLLKQLGN